MYPLHFSSRFFGKIMTLVLSVCGIYEPPKIDFSLQCTTSSRARYGLAAWNLSDKEEGETESGRIIEILIVTYYTTISMGGIIWKRAGRGRQTIYWHMYSMFVGRYMWVHCGTGRERHTYIHWCMYVCHCECRFDLHVCMEHFSRSW